jgi:hypothetical protein
MVCSRASPASAELLHSLWWFGPQSVVVWAPKNSVLSASEAYCLAQTLALYCSTAGGSIGTTYRVGCMPLSCSKAYTWTAYADWRVCAQQASSVQLCKGVSCAAESLEALELDTCMDHV